MLVRPIGESQRGQSYKIISNIMGLFIPNQCQFIINEEQLVRFRIDPKIDEEVRQMYKYRKDSEVIGDTEEQGVELNPSEVPNIPESPLDEKQDSTGSEKHHSSSVDDDTVDFPDVEGVVEPTPIIATQDELNLQQSLDANPPKNDDNNFINNLSFGDPNTFNLNSQHHGVEEKVKPETMFEDQKPQIEENNFELFPATIVFNVGGTPIPPGPDSLEPSSSVLVPPKSVKSLNTFYRRMKVRCSIKKEFRRFYSDCNF